MIGHHGTLLEITHSTTVATVMQSIKGMKMKLLQLSTVDSTPSPSPRQGTGSKYYCEESLWPDVTSRSMAFKFYSQLYSQGCYTVLLYCTVKYCYTVILYSLWADAAYSQGWALWAQSQLPQLQNSTHIATYAILHRSFLKCSVKSTFWKHFSALLSVLIKIDCRDCSEETNIIKKAHIVAPG